MRALLLAAVFPVSLAAAQVPESFGGEDRPTHRITIPGTDFRAMSSAPVPAALEFLGARLGIEAEHVGHVGTHRSPGGSTVRFVQMVGGYPVVDSDIAVTLDRSGRVAYVSSGFRDGLMLRTPAARGGAEAASRSLARNHLGISSPEFEQAETVVFVAGDRARLAHRVEMIAMREKPGNWEVLVDAADGRILRTRDRMTRHRHDGPDRPLADVRPVAEHRASPSRAEGLAMVFDPDPLSRAGVAYGGTFSDGDDADTDDLNAQRIQVTLPDIAFDGASYTLSGPYARVVDPEPPFLGTYVSASADYSATRSDSTFEAANAYYHLDRSLRYIHDQLGFSALPPDGSPVSFDPQGWDGQDQSSFSPMDHLLSFGEGGVDDAEDPDVVLHELGHALHDWLSGGNISNVEGLSEGIGDYWANSYSRHLNFWDASREERAWVFHWDGHNEFFAGRTTAYDALYPGGLVDQIHTDGQIWAAAMMEIWEHLGRETTDALMLQAITMLGPGASQPDAAFAVLAADTLLNAGANGGVIQEVLLRRGYLLRANFAASARAGTAPLTVQFFDASFSAGTGGIVSRAWDLNGDGVVDATTPTAQYTYDTPGLYTVSLTISDGSAETTLELEHFVSVNEGIYLWQGGRTQFDRSGDYLRNHFLLRGLTNAYSHSNRVHAPLAGYDAVFLSLGSFETGASRLDEGMAGALRTYIQSGGQVYIDGGEAFGFDQVGDASFLALFGLSGSDDGTSDPAPVQALTGQSGSLTQGMVFEGSTQAGISWMDRFEPQPPAVAAFVEPGYGTVAVENVRVNGARTFVMSYALGHLEDGSGASTREELADRILAFFGIGTSTQVETGDGPAAFGLEPAWPNPSRGHASIAYSLSRPEAVTLEVFDLLGRRVRLLQASAHMPAGRHVEPLNGDALPGGAYVIRLTAGERVSHQRLVIVR